MIEQATATGRMRAWNIVTASGIAVLILLMFVMVMHHPVATPANANDLVGSIARLAAPDQVVHGILAAAMTVMTSLMLGFASRLGLNRPHVLLGAVSSALALVLICLAVLLDGFVAPALALRCVTIGTDCARETEALLRFGGLQIEFMTRLGLYSLAGATALWAGDLILRKDSARTAGALGMLSATAQVGILVLGGERLTPHSLGLIVAAQAIWYVGVAGTIAFQRGPFDGSQVSAPRRRACPK